jgi:uncharacterized protein (TIGR03435 family)
MFTTAAGAFLAMFAGCVVYGQTFDVASIKPATPQASNGMVVMRRPSGGPGSNDPGRIRYSNMSLKNLLMNAYDVTNFQVAGPAWLESERFDIEATMPPDTTREQFRAMLRNMLAERFQMAIRKETKELPMYSLVLAKNGSKMKESATVTSEKDGDTLPLPMPSQPKTGPDGFPVIPVQRGLFQIMMPGRARMVAQQQTMQEFVERLTNVMGRPVSDATGLKEKYDFTLTYSPEGLNYPMPPPILPGGTGGASAGGPAPAPSDAEPLLDIFGAVQSQLGLRLEAKKGPVDMIVVDHGEKTPTEN